MSLWRAYFALHLLVIHWRCQQDAPCKETISGLVTALPSSFLSQTLQL